VIYDRYAARMNGLALKILSDVFLAEEVLQEVFIKIWKNPDQFNKTKGTPLAWMMVLCRNLAIDKLRAKKRVESRTTNLDENLLFQHNIWAPEDPAQSVDYYQIQKSVRKALSQLPFEQSQPIEMAFFQGYSQSEISHAMNLPLGTVKTRMRLGMQKLRSFFQPLNQPKI
jgi:RNA polymerase sigma-70 factor (ECF subfamily)